LGVVICDWLLHTITNPKSPIPNPQSPKQEKIEKI